MNSLFGYRGNPQQRPPPPPSPSTQNPPQRGAYDRVPPADAARNGPPQPAHGRGHYDEPIEKSGHSHGNGQVWQLRPARSPSDEITYGNIVAVSPHDFPPHSDGDFYVLVKDLYVFSARLVQGYPQGQISLSNPQRTWASISLQDVVNVRLYDPFAQGGAQHYIGSADVEVGFATRNATAEQLDQDDLAASFIRNYENQILAPGQRVLMDFRSIPMLFVIKTVQLGDLSMERGSDGESLTLPTARGILTRGSQMNFFKDAKSPINLKGSKRRPATNAILQPSFRFEDMGIGGLDKEFSIIFRRAFASRIFPPGLIQNMGIQHVKGILLYGPPGTGKTLIARKIGQMLNAREPKVINGPEVLNKYVGQSEENIRKLFADAEKEYKEMGDESGLHIIIFDELDAVCKQRGSGGGGGTGVGDSVVNQLLSKLDGVDQLNNILLIGMTNRKDMIDDALLRPGRLEVHVEISLPDEGGRVQILNIHTAEMRKHGRLDPDVDLAEVAHRAKNFSGAELSGLIRSAASSALERHVKVGTVAGISEDVDSVTVKSADFDRAFDDVRPAFGVSEDELSDLLTDGIIRFSPYIDNILEEGDLIVQNVQATDSRPLFSAVLHGPPGSGKTALAAQIALDSEYPFIKLCSPENMTGFNEAMRIDHMRKIFEDSYKSPLSLIVIDDIERIIEWNPIGPRFSNAVLQALMVLVKKRPPKGRRLLVLATTSQRSVMQQMDLLTSFGKEIAVPSVGSVDQLLPIIEKSGVFPDPQRALMQLKETLRDDTINVGVKNVLEAINLAKRDPDICDRFAHEMAGLVAQRG